jgi:hypothetical protein
LLDDDPSIRRRGLYVFGFIGGKAFVVLDDALASIDDPSVNARSNLMDGVLSFAKELSPRQAQLVLKLANDPEDLVRDKVVAFLGAAVLETIESAIELFAEPLRSEYRTAFETFSAEPSQAQALLEQGLASTCVQSAFALAAIERMAREDRLISLPEYFGDSYLGQSVLANTARLMRNAARIRTKRAERDKSEAPG